MNTKDLSRTMTEAGQANTLAGSAIQVISPAPRKIWSEIIASSPTSLIDQTPDWIDCICAAGKFEDASRLYRIGDTEIVLPMVRARSRLPFWQVQSSHPPAWGIGGLVTAQPLQPAQIAAVFEDLARMKVVQTRIRPNPLEGELWAAAKPRRVLSIPRLAHVLDLEGGFDQVWSKRFASFTRTKVRKAEKSGLVIECDNTGRLVPVFYELLEKSVDRWAEKQNEPEVLALWRTHRRDPISKFEQILKRVGQNCCIWVAWYQGEPAASIIVLKGNSAHSIRGAMNKELAGPTEANTLIQSMAIEDASRFGCRYYHMGETGANQSLAHFKARFGAKAYPYAEYIIERLPVTAADQNLRRLIKKLIGFKDA